MKKKLMIFLFVLWGCMISSAFAYTYPAQSVSAPTYQFQSTSTVTSVVGQSSFTSSTIYAPCSNAPASKPRRAGEYNPWDEDGDGAFDPWGDDNDPTGEEIGQVNTPIGSPWILLVCAVGYIIIRRKKQRI